MIQTLSNNGVLAALFGPGMISPVQRHEANRALPASLQAQNDEDHPQPLDRVELSTEGRRAAELFANQGAAQSSDIRARDAKAATSLNESSQRDPGSLGETDLSQEEQAEVRELKQRDQEVRRHEQAHKAAAGGHANGGPTFEFAQGPDGRQYAVGGEVSIDTSAVEGDPQATITKMQQIRRAALAPAQPSSQDRAVAAQAAQSERQARTELAEEKRESATNQQSTGNGTTISAAQGTQPNLPAQQATGSTNASRIAAAFSQAVSSLSSRPAALFDITV